MNANHDYGGGVDWRESSRPRDPERVTVLMVDDDLVDIRLVQRSMRKCGLSNPIMTARDGIEALEFLRGTNGRQPPPWPYVVLLDLNLPRMNGIEFLETIRGDPNLRRTVVFMLTTSENDRDMLAAYRNNVAGYLVKSSAYPGMLAAMRMLGKYIATMRFPRAPLAAMQSSCP